MPCIVLELGAPPGPRAAYCGAAEGVSRQPPAIRKLPTTMRRHRRWSTEQGQGLVLRASGSGSHLQLREEVRGGRVCGELGQHRLCM